MECSIMKCLESKYWLIKVFLLICIVADSAVYLRQPG